MMINEKVRRLVIVPNECTNIVVIVRIKWPNHTDLYTFLFTRKLLLSFT